MFAEINQQIARLQQQIQDKKTYRTHLDHIQMRIRELRRQCLELEERLEKEETDVAKLKGVSFKNLLHTALGNKDEKLQKERNEALSAKYVFEQTKDTLRAYLQEEAEFKDKLSGIGQPQAHLDELIRKKEAMLNTMPHSQQARLQTLNEQIQTTEKQKYELHEAYKVGQQVVSALEQIDESFRKAEDWGGIDTFGGGIVASSIKSDHISSARHFIMQNRALFERYQKELTDVHLDLNGMILEFTTWDHWAETFFDNIFTDWETQGRIEESRRVVNQNLKEVKKTQLILWTKLEDVSNALEDLAEQRIHAIAIAS